MIKHLKKLIKEFLNEQKTLNPYVIEDINPHKDTLKVIYRLRGKSNTWTVDLNELIFDDDLLSQFDPITVKFLTFLLLKSSLSPELTIETQKLDSQIQSFILSIRSNKTGEIMNTSAEDIIKEKEQMTNLSRAESEQVNYLAGYNKGYKDAVDEAKLLTKKLEGSLNGK